MIVGLTRIRNEEDIIQDTLDHMAEFCERIYVFDDASTDRTVDICKAHPKVGKVLVNPQWRRDRLTEEYRNRQMLLEMARDDSPKARWFVYMDADERIDWDFKGYESYDAVAMRLFDYYIAEGDKDKPYTEREYLGPEYRTIKMMFRNRPDAKYYRRDQREIAFLSGKVETLEAGYVKHYGKAISLEEWEKTCDYYWLNFPEPYRSKWLKRKGHAVHTESDFGRPLITWDEKEKKGVLLCE